MAGELAEYITKALGIYRTGVAKDNVFNDVTKSNKLADAITIASKYGIINGYLDGSFRSDSLISRTEAMVMYARAMNVAGLIKEIDDRVETYEDKDLVASWAYSDVRKVISAGVFNGVTPTLLAPLKTFTYAESATAVRNLLIETLLIDKRVQGLTEKLPGSLQRIAVSVRERGAFLSLLDNKSADSAGINDGFGEKSQANRRVERSEIMKYANSMADLVGNTPLVKLQKISSEANLFAKCEFMNPISIKDRPVLQIIDHAEATGALNPGDTLIEMTSGNTGMAIAYIAAAHREVATGIS